MDIKNIGQNQFKMEPQILDEDDQEEAEEEVVIEYEDETV